MNIDKTTCRRWIYPTLLGIFATAAAAAQNTTAKPLPDSDEEEAAQLSPFVVKADADKGYVATDSLAGTRLKTPLKDIAASISVVTKDLLSDLAATNSDQLLVYTTGTEVGGMGGNFSNSINAQYSQDFENQRRSPDSDTRVRGLASADRTRNYFGSLIPFDSYNTQSVTINRGANSILFGLGSPAGIMEASTEMPSFRNRNEVQLRVGSFGSTRQSLDFDRELIDEKLALRVAALNENRDFEQKPAYRDQARVYGALEFRPFKNTALRVNAEQGRIEQRLPRIDPPLDAMSSWWDFGKPERTTTLFNTANANYQAANNLSGAAGNWFEAPSLIYYSPNDPTPSDGFSSFSTVNGVRYTYLVPRSSKDVALTVKDPLAGFLVSKQMIDRSVFDYRTQMIDGPNSRLNLDFDAINISLEQLFMDGNAGVELVYDEQHSETGWYDRFYTWRGNTIYIDPNRETVYGAPNPNFGRPFLSGGGGWSNYVERDQENFRGTGFLQHDFGQKNGNWLGRLLGKHVLTGFYTTTSNSNYHNSGPSAAIAPTYYSGRNQNTLETDRPLGTVVYLGDSLANASSPAGAGLQGVTVDLMPSNTASVWTNNARTSHQWEKQTHDVYTFRNYEWLARNTNYDETDVESFGLVWQGGWANNLLVSTVGWRHDEVESASAVQTVWDPVTGARPTEAPELPVPLAAENELVSYGFALHVPKTWTQGWWSRPQFSLYYNQSENFDIAAVRQTVLGDPIPPQSGESEEIGVGVAMFDDRLNFRATWYETTQDNISDPRFNATALVRAVDMELRILESNTQAQLAAANYVHWDDPSVPEAYRRYLETYSWKVSATPNANGTVDASYIRAPGATEPTSSISRGFEFEMTYNPSKNWRIMFNAAQQKAERGEAGAYQREFLEARIAEWSRPEVAVLSAGSTTNTVEAYRISSFTPYQQAIRSKGQPASELREWRANLITNYTFDKDTVFKGWSIGGAARWQDAVAIGFPVLATEDGTLYEDVHNPFMGDENIKVDAWLAYSRPLFNKKVTWKIQLNVRNVFNEGLLVPVRANPVAIGDKQNFEIGAWRMGEKRTWELTSTFKF